MIPRLIFVALLLFAVPCVRAAELEGISGFIDEMVSKHQFNRDELEQVFKHAEHRQAIIDAISAPATLKPWPEYRAAFINPQRISGGLQFWQRHADALKRAQDQYGIPQEVIVALIGVETRYGLNMGKYSTLDALTTLAFDYPRRADFFRGELEQFLLLAREQALDLYKVQGSYAGALGIPQFMPGSYRKYAVDFSGNAKIDLLQDPVDAIGSVANYLKHFGWQSDQPVTMRASIGEDNCAGSLAEVRTVAEWLPAGIKPEQPIAADIKALLIDFSVPEGKEFWLAFTNFDVITRYNNSDFYAMSVFQLAQALREAHP
jgi:membrane-bound lytic murein transglycosylase B